MRYNIMNSVLGPILFSRDDKGINRVHLLDSTEPSPVGKSWQQASQDPLLQKSRSQLIDIIVPLHRVIGNDGGLVGFTGGLEKKRYLISLEQSYADISSLSNEQGEQQ